MAHVQVSLALGDGDFSLFWENQGHLVETMRVREKWAALKWAVDPENREVGGSPLKVIEGTFEEAMTGFRTLVAETI